MNRNYATQFTQVIPFENCIPYLYRYEDEQWIEDFFNNGNLFISSFKNYKKYEDNQLGDKHEGSSLNVVNGNNDKSIITYTTVGFNEYTFCASTVLDNDLKKTFSRNSVFRIKDPLNFMIEIANSIPRIQSVIFGNCLYVNERIISTAIPSALNIDDLKDDKEPDKTSFEKMMNAAAPALTRHRFFLKHADYQKQSEYRMLWSIDRNVDQGIILHCPEARQFCERIK